MMLKPSIHQLAALWWIVAGSTFLLPLAAISTKANAAHLILCDIAGVTAIIALVPLALRWGAFRRWFCWTDALSERERRLIAARDGAGFHREAYAQKYVLRVKPYIFRIYAVEFAILAAQWAIPDDMDLARAVLSAAGFYPIGVALLVILSLPIGEHLRHMRRGCR